MPRPNVTGVVVSQGKMAKTVKIRIKKLKWNRIVSKYVADYKTMLVHDELNKCREGDVVRAQYVRPLSARKSWAVAEIMKLKGTSWQRYQDTIPSQVREDELAKLQEFQEASRLRLGRGGVSEKVVQLQELQRSLQGPTGTETELSLSPERAAELREKYGLDSWPPTKEIEIDLSVLEKEIEAIRAQVDGVAAVAAEARRLLAEEPERANEILKALGKDPAILRPGIKRNMLLKYLKNKPQDSQESV